MNCELIAERRLLYELADDSLSADLAKDVEAHLHECENCRHEEARIRSLMNQISSLAAGPDFRDLTNDGRAPFACTSHEAGGKPITEQDVLALKIALIKRDFTAAHSLIDYHFDTLVNLDCDQENATSWLALFARWMDMGYAHVGLGRPEDISRLEMVKAGLRVFPGPPRRQMPFLDLVNLRMASAYVALAEHRDQEALEHFSCVKKWKEDVGDPDIIALAHYGIAKVHRRRGRYEQAEPHVCRAIQLAGEANHVEMVAGFSIMLAWIAFQRGHSHQAKEILCKSETVLRRTNDHLRLGNIHSLVGRIGEQEGHYHDALRNYDKALEAFRKWSPSHPNIGRTHVNRASVLRLLALRELRKGRDDSSRAQNASIWRDEALEDLRIASELFVGQKHGRGQARVKLVSSLLRFDLNELEEALIEAEEAYQLAMEHMDPIVMVRSRLATCTIEHARFAKTPEGSPRAEACVEHALSCADEAIEIAESTQNKYLRARANIWRGLSVLLPAVEDRREARKSYRRAVQLLVAHGRSYAADELQLLCKALTSKPRRHSVQLLSSQRRPRVASR